MEKLLNFFPVEASTGAVAVDKLFFFLIAVAGTIVLLVGGLIVGFSWRYRRSAQNERPPLPEWLSRDIEIGWTVATFFAFLFIFWWAASLKLATLDQPKHAVRIHVIAKQWMWKAEHGNGIREINELHVPVGRNILVSLNSQDVIHSFYVPAFRVKRDVVPGYTEQIWFKPDRPGRYELLCAEFCGTGHSRMRGDVIVMSAQDYAAWTKSAPNRDNLVREGADLFRSYGCAGCHQGAEPGKAPGLAGLYNSTVHLADGRTVTADDSYIRDSIMFSNQDVVAGFNPIMPSYKGRISDNELRRLLAYIKSLSEKR